jgi:hypothetical protein
MNDKFKFAPGMPGFGTKGIDGSTGSQGLAMYFTDFNPVSDINAINSRIALNFDLWKNFNNPLPDGRTYVTGDLFFDSDGKAYEINAETNTFSSIGGNLNMGGFFVPLGINSDNGFQRYFNSNSSPKYIIDNIYTDAGAINYTESPLNIYGIDPKDFARIEYSNVQKLGSLGDPLNPFTVYSSGEVGGSDDQKSIAIVRDASHNLFRIGNLDDAGNLRNVSLIFDVSSLIHTKQSGNYFSANSPVGSILTNYEINANTLFDPNFNVSPASFIGVMGTTDASIIWNLLDFTNDAAVTGDLYFFESLAPFTGNTFRIDSSAARPLVFSNVDPSGSIRIAGISSSKAYGFYMKLSKNGWVRNSTTKYVYQGNINVTPTSFVLSSSDADITTCKFNVDANFTWNASIYSNPGGMISGITCSSIGGLDGSIFFNITENSSTKARLGKIRVGLLPGMGTYQDVSIYQPRGVIGPELFLYSPVGSTSNFSYVSYPNYYLDASQNGTIKGGATLTINVSTNQSWTATNIPSWATLVPSSGAGSHGAILTVSPNNTVNSRNQGIVFNFGGDTPVYLYLSQEEVQVWIEYTETDTYTLKRIPISPYGGEPLAYSYPQNKWHDDYNNANVSGSYFSFGMKTTNNVALPFLWTIPPAASSWLSGYPLSGTTPTSDSYSSIHAFGSYSPGQYTVLDCSIDSAETNFILDIYTSNY